MEKNVKDRIMKIKFPQGLYGFEEYKDFILLPSEYEPLLRLESEKDKNLAFFLVDPFLFFPMYEIDVDDATVAELGIENPNDVMVLTLITISKSLPVHVTANLQGPVVINQKSSQAKQIVLVDTHWKTKHDLFEKKASEPVAAC